MRTDLHVAAAAARDGYRFRKAPKPEVIEASLSPDEKVLQVLFCQKGTKAATIILTDRQIYVFAKGNVFGSLVAADEVIPIAMITGVERSREYMNEWGITITRASNVDKYIYCDEVESQKFVSQVRELIAAAQSPAPTVIQTQTLDPLDQLKKLKELHEAGVISDEEYETKRADLMGRI